MSSNSNCSSPPHQQQQQSSSSSSNFIVVSFGGVCLDYLAVLSSFPKPDDKTSCRSMTIQTGGGAANTATCLSRLGLQVRLVSKIGDDVQGCSIVEELQAEGINTSFLVVISGTYTLLMARLNLQEYFIVNGFWDTCVRTKVAEGGRSPFSYIIVEQKTNTRTCILSRGNPVMVPDDVKPASLESALNGASLTYFDARYPDAGLVVAREAARKGIPILVDADKKRDGLDELLNLSDYAVCTTKFLQTWTGAPSLPSAMISMLLKLPKLRFVIVTLGENGCILLELCSCECPALEEDADGVLESLKQQKDDSIASPFCIPSPVMRLKADGIGTVVGRMLLGTAEKIPSAELVDTTGAGDSFIGGIIYALCNHMTSEKMLPFAAKVAAVVCRFVGARTGLPKSTDPHLLPFLQ